MAKLAFTKFGIKTNVEVETFEFNEQIVEVKQYLPINDKLALISEVINNSADDNNFANPVKVDVYATIAIVEAYTNITFTDKQKEDVTKLYDKLVSSDLYQTIIRLIPVEEINGLFDALSDSIDAVYNYRNSVMGILENISTDYSNLDLDASTIQAKLADPENMALLKGILTKLG